MNENYNRIIAELNAESDGIWANCEECGVSIPIEYHLCRNCEIPNYDVN
jgi:hypothetical protein